MIYFRLLVVGAIAWVYFFSYQLVFITKSLDQIASELHEFNRRLDD